MEPPRGWRLPQGEKTPSRAHPTIRRSRHQRDQSIPWPAWEQTDGPLTMPGWKRFVLMHVRPVCIAMLWQLGVVIGLLGVFFLGLTLFRLLRP
jgi:hypothetical protein